MTENERIKKHIEDCEHRIGNILGFMESNSDADIFSCEENIVVLKEVIIALEEIQQYRAIGTVEECRTAVERMKPKKPFFNGANYECPNCYTRPYADDAEDKKPMLCDICGQKLDWQ